MFYYKVFKALEGIDYAVVGGFAVALHGATRGTVDLDVVISFRREEFLRVEAALLGIGLSPRVPLKATEVFEFRKDYIQKRNLIAWSFVNTSKPIEVVDIILTHDRKTMKTKTLDVRGIKIPVASIADLIQMKKQSGRPQDLEDIKMLEAIRREKS